MAEAAEQLGVVASRASVAMGARVEGIDLAAEGGGDVIAELRELLLEHHLLVLPGQRYRPWNWRPSVVVGVSS